MENNEFNLTDLRRIFSHNKLKILLITFLFTCLSIIYSLRIPNEYNSEAVLLPASNQKSLNVPGQLGSLAALAGINLGAGDEKIQFAVELLKSKEFIGKFIEDNNLVISLMAAKGWNRVENTIIIDPEIYDMKNEKWIRIVDEPYGPIPSKLETIEEFNKRFNITENKENGTIKLSFQHYSPYFCKSVLDRLIDSINEEIRKRDIYEAESAVKFLQLKLKETNISEMKKLIFTLIEEQTKTIMLANVTKEYVLRTVDQAIVPEKKSKPRRALIVLFSFFTSLIVTISVLMILSYKKK